MPLDLGKFQKPNQNAIDAKRAAIEAAKQRALGSGSADNPNAIVRWAAPADCADRIRIVFDDSGSMGSYITSAKQGVVEFLKNCIPNQTAVALHFMNTSSWNTALRSDLPALGADITEAKLCSGGTPFFNTLKRALEATPRATRLVAFTDGSPTDRLSAENEAELQNYWFSPADSWTASADVIITISKSQSPAIPIDTVFFGYKHSAREIALLKYLSEKTGGFFLHFDPSKPNILKQLKYLAPINRLRLTDGAFRAAVERGE